VLPYQAVLEAITPKLVYEWGPGRNSDMALRHGAKVFAVEQNIKFVPPNIRRNLRVCLCNVSSDEYPKPLLLDADIYFVDSRRRAECITAVFESCVESAVVALHDAQRERYHDALRLFPHVKFLRHGFCIASRDERILEIN
jgi:hypothetical protein